MAESRRKSLREVGHDEEHDHTKRDIFWLAMMVLAGVLVIVGMFAISHFLSGR